MLIPETGLTRDQFADKSGKSRNQIFKYLKGDALPTADFFAAIKKEFPWVNIEWLITGDGEMMSTGKRTPEAGNSQILHGNGNIQIGGSRNGNVEVGKVSHRVRDKETDSGMILTDDLENTLQEYVSEKIAKEIIKKLSK